MPELVLSLKKDNYMNDNEEKEQDDDVKEFQEEKQRPQAKTRSRADNSKKQKIKRKRKKRNKKDESGKFESVSSVKFIRSYSYGVIEKKKDKEKKVSPVKPRFQGQRTHLAKDSMDVFRNSDKLDPQWKSTKNSLLASLGGGDNNNQPIYEKDSLAE